MDAHVDKQELLAIVDRHQVDYGGLIAMLEEIQAIYGYLPEAGLRLVAEATKHALVDVYGVATFYRPFSLRPRGKHHLCVCLGTACHVRNAPMVVEEFERQLGVNAGETTPDGEVTLETVSCLGACALGPIVVVDGTYHSKVTPTAVKKILDTLQTETEPAEMEPAATA